MTALTDKDLKAFSARHAQTIHTREYPPRCATCRVLGRLAAAERVIEYSYGPQTAWENKGPRIEAIRIAMEEWRKAAGK